MASSYNYIKRHIKVNGMPTTIAIEKLYWSALDKIATQSNKTPDQIIATLLKAQPPDYQSRAGWLRLTITAQLLTAFLKTKQESSIKSAHQSNAKS